MTEILHDQDALYVEEEQQQSPAKRRGFGLGSIVLLMAIVLAGAIVGVALMERNAGRPTSGPAPEFGFTTFDGERFAAGFLAAGLARAFAGFFAFFLAIGILPSLKYRPRVQGAARPPPISFSARSAD